MRRLVSRRTTVLASVVGLVGVGTGVAVAGVVTIPVDTTPATIRVVQNDFPEGVNAPWHTHPGAVIVQVQEGFLKIYQGSCQPTVVKKGETFLEVPFVPVRADSPGPVTWTTTLIIPTGRPASTPFSPDPCG